MFGYKWTRNVQFTLLCLAFALIFMLPQWIRERSLAMKLGLAAALVAAFFMLAGMAQANGGGGQIDNAENSVALLTCRDAHAVLEAYEWLMEVVSVPPHCNPLGGARMLGAFYAHPQTMSIDQLAGWLEDADGDPMAPFELTYQGTDGSVQKVWLVFWILESEES